MCQDSISIANEVASNPRTLSDGLIAPDGHGGANQSDIASETHVRVLVVDDQQDVLDMMEVVMRRRSIQVLKATSGAQALKLAPHFAPHVVVSDISMPGMDGYELMSALRAMSELQDFKSIALSGYDASEEKERAKRAGYDVQLTKPVDFEQLLQTITTLRHTI